MTPTREEASQWLSDLLVQPRDVQEEIAYRILVNAAMGGECFAFNHDLAIQELSRIQDGHIEQITKARRAA